MAFKQALDAAAGKLRMKVPNKRGSEFRKYFLGGVMCFEPLVLPILAAEVPGEWIYANADGVRGGKTRVMRCFPRIDEWEGQVPFHIFDDTIPQEVFEFHLSEAGKFIGIGRFRPENGGFYGRWQVLSVTWQASDNKEVA
jgi:hypothetical protein